MKYCVRCGHQLDDGALYCLECGQKAGQIDKAEGESGVAIASMVLGISSVSLLFFSLFFLFFLPFLCLAAAIVGLALSGRKRIYRGGPFGLTGFVTSLVGLVASLVAVIIVIVALFSL